MFSATSSHSLLADDYKSRPIATYHDPKGSPFLDHYRLRVPKYRSIIELLNFIILLFLFVLCISSECSQPWISGPSRADFSSISDKNFAQFEWSEIAFCVYTLGFILDEFAASQVGSSPGSMKRPP